MPNIFRSLEVADYFVEYDFGPEAREGGRFDAAIRHDFEHGKCIVLKNWKVDFDSEFFSNLDLENNRAAKKLKCRVDDDGNLDLKQLNDNLEHCAKDDDTKAKFPSRALQVSKQVTPILTRIFRGQVFLDRRLTWRMLETVHEDLHIDIYPEEKDDFQIRMFVNLDVSARIWHTSHELETLLEHFGDRITDEELRTLGPTALCKTLNTRVYGGLGNAGRDGQPRHSAFFEPGEVWMVDSRRISHQIFYGRRALSLDFLATPASMQDPSSYYLNTVEKYRASRGQSLRPVT